MTKLSLIGGGQMGRALVGGMISGGIIQPTDVCLFDPSVESQRWWTDHQPGVTVCPDQASAVAASEQIILAVKPHHIVGVAKQSEKYWQGKLVISIAAGVTLSRLTEWIQHDRVVRVMPNTPCLVGAGASGYCCGNAATSQDRKQVHAMLSAVGCAVQVDEDQLHAVTGLSGSGPAYVFMMIEALADGGVKAGLTRPIAMQLAAATLRGAASMVEETSQHPGALKDAVASPGGTTIAAIGSLEQNGLRGALIEAVQVAAQRSRDLSAT
ncbi:MAG: pyrroline-5-carboxylate reductase [Planctomycetota bacterium]